MPSAVATASMARSIEKHACGRETPRYGPSGHLLVVTLYASHS